MDERRAYEDEGAEGECTPGECFRGKQSLFNCSGRLLFQVRNRLLGDLDMERNGASAIVLCALTTAIASVARGEEAGATDAQLSDVVIADELRTAFYEHAPLARSAAIAKAVRAWCSGADRERVANSNESHADTVGWLCAENKLRYFRSVYVSGDKGPHLLVCEDNGTSGLKYFGVDLVDGLIEEGACVSVEFNGTTYELYFNSAN